MKEERLLICMNSLHYVARSYDTVVIDESETVLMKWMGDFMNQKVKTRKLENWAKFISLIRSAKRVILLDAFTSTKTLELMQQISPAGSSSASKSPRCARWSTSRRRSRW